MSIDYVGENSLTQLITEIKGKIPTDMPTYNPNLLINPDFCINQRGQTSYTGNTVYTVDRWKMSYSSLELRKVVTPTDSGVTITTTAGAGHGFFMDFGQTFENKLPSGIYTMSAKINGIVRTYTGQLDTDGVLFDGVFVLYQRAFSVRCIDADVNIEWVKLERGSTATPFVPPDPATELLRCQRYYEVIDNRVNYHPAVQWSGDLIRFVASYNCTPKRSTPITTITGAGRLVTSAGITTPSSLAVRVDQTNVNLTITLASPTTTPQFGWIDGISIALEAEI